MTYKSHIISFIVASTCLCGCNLISVGDLTIEDKERIVRDAASATVGLAIIHSNYDDVSAQVKAAVQLKEDVEENVLSLLSDPDVIFTYLLQDLAFSKVPQKYATYLQPAQALLSSYYTISNVSVNTDSENLRLLKSFFEGIVDGCCVIINALGDGNGSDCNAGPVAYIDKVPLEKEECKLLRS